MFDSAAGTVNSADIYGTPAWGGQAYDPISAFGPNQGSVATMASQASGDGNSYDGGGAAAFSWIGFAIALVLLRVTIDLSDRA